MTVVNLLRHSRENTLGFEPGGVNKLKALTFSLEIPDDFEDTRVFLETARAETYKFEYVMQNPEFNLGLEEVEDLADRQGETFLDRCLSRIHDFGENARLLERVDQEICGEPAACQEAVVDWEYDEKLARVHYFVGGVKRSEQYCYPFKAYCEESVVKHFRPIFLNIWMSLQWFGEAKAAIAERDRALGALTGALEPSQEEEPEVKAFEIPQDGRPVFKVDGFDVVVGAEDLKAEICPDLHLLSVSVKVAPNPQMPDFEEVVGYPEEGLSFRLHFSNVCAKGSPEGEFEYEFGRCDSRDTYLWDSGWDYSLEFSGRVTLAGGWLGMNGYMSKQYESDFKAREIELYYPLPLEHLDWSNYRFQSLLETVGVDPSSVRFLTLTDPGYTALPNRVLSFTNLRELTVTGGPQHPGRSQRMPLDKLPEEIGSLSALSSLSLNGLDLKSLPQTLGELKNLQYLSVTHTPLKTMPEAVWSLPSLKHLIFNHNRLAELPPKGDLPSLETLNLSYNQLTTLPDWVSEIPNLRSLHVHDNPWESLRQKLLEIADLGLEQADKMRLFDYSYPGAQGQGAGKWDDESFFLRSDAEEWNRFAGQLKNTEFAPFEDALKKVAKKSVYLQHLPEEGVERVGETRFGGWPDLPQTLSYPRTEFRGESYALEFLAQLNCEELAPYQDYLPRRGMLYFFINDQEDCEPVVLYHEGPLENLQPGSEAGFPDEFFNLPDGPYAPYRVSVQMGWSLPSDYAAYCNTHYFPGEAAVLAGEEGLTDQIIDELLGFEPQARHEINGYVFTQNESPELQAALKLRGRPEDWTVLLKVASQGDFQWCDAGDLFFVIHKSDLARGDFSNVYCSLESS